MRRCLRWGRREGSSDTNPDPSLTPLLHPLTLIGQARRKLGQKSGEWTEEQNKKLLFNMGADLKTGNVPMEKFVGYFDKSLPPDMTGFNKTMDDFIECARSLRIKKTDARKKAAEDEAAKKRKEAQDAREAELQKKEEDAKRAKKAAEDEAERKRKEGEAAKRMKRLQDVYREFDLDGGGEVGFEEMFELGKARRKLGQKSGKQKRAHVVV